jgi:hypothetical protein
MERESAGRKKTQPVDSVIALDIKKWFHLNNTLAKRSTERTTCRRKRREASAGKKIAAVSRNSIIRQLLDET